MKDLAISIIIPVYNAEKYLEKCIDSIIGQSIGFEDNIELILVNDGSSDSSGIICKSYKYLYPDNIHYIEKKNSGVSAARNTGIENVKTKYFGFIDSDDYISKNVISSVIDYFENNTIDSVVATIKVVNFGAKRTPHPTDEKFRRGKNIHDLKNPDSFDVCSRVAPAFFRTEQAKKYKFDESITAVYEDTKYITEVLFDYPLLGVVNKGIYYYRRFKTDDDFDTSLTTGITTDKRFYNQTLEKITLEILEKKAIKPSMSTYLDYVALYTFRWIILYNLTDPREILSESEYSEFLKLKEKIFSLVSDSSITSFEVLSPFQKVYLLSLKHNHIISNNIKCDSKGDLLYDNNKISNILKNTSVYITSQYIDNNILTIKGMVKTILTETINLHSTVNGKDYGNIQIINDFTSERSLEDSKPFSNPRFIMKLPLNNKRDTIKFFFKVNNEKIEIDKIKVAKSNKKFKKSYYEIKNHYICRAKKSITVMEKNKRNLLLIVLKRYKKKLKKVLGGK